MATIKSAGNTFRFVWNHPCNNGSRLRAVGRAANFHFRHRLLRRRTIAELGDKSIIWADPRRRSTARILYAKLPDRPEMLVWQRAIRHSDLFIDVGANIGCYSIWAAELGAEVIALEPADDTFSLLVENVALNGYQITTIRAGAGAAPGLARFTVGQDSLNHLDPSGGAEIKVITIDSVIEHRKVAGMKVDVEGLEIDVLRGCEKALSEHRISLIQMEWNVLSRRAGGTDRQPVVEILSRHGYRLYRPNACGELQPISDPGFGSDVFACPI